MSILINKSTRVLCQGITGKAGAFHTKGCKEYGTQMVGGVTPGKAGETVEGLPVFDTVIEAVEKTGANATMIFVPAAFTADAILEALDAGIKVICAITEGVPVLDMVRVYELVRRSDAAFIAGRTAPPGRRMGHAGAIISGGKGTAAEKVAALAAANIEVAASPADMGQAVQRAMAKRKS